MSLTFDEAKNLGWAKESTLEKLLESSRGTPQLIKLIAERFNINQGAIEQAYRGVTSSTRRMGNEILRAGAKAAEPMKEAGDDIANLARLQKNITTSLMDQIRSLSSTRDPQSILGGIAGRLRGAATAFENTSGAAGVLAKKLLLVSSGIGLLGSMVQHLTDVMQAMQGVYASGVLVETGLSGLVQAASNSGIAFREFAAILSRHGAVAVTLGTKATVDLTRRFQTLTRFGGDLMMSQQEGAEAFLDVLEMMRVSGEIKGMSDEQLAQRGTGLLKTFNELAIATGRNRDELRKQTADIMRQPLTSLMSRLLPPEGRQRLTEFTARMTAQFGQQADTMVKMVERVAAANGSFALMDENMKPLISLVPGFGQALQRAGQGIRNGSMTAEQAAQELAGTLDNLGANGEAQLRTLAMANPALAGQVEMLLQARAQSKAAREQLVREATARGMTIEQLEAERKETQRRLGNIRASMNGANSAVNRLTNAFSKIAASLSGIITPALDLLAGGLNLVAGAMEIFADIIQPLADLFDSFRQGLMSVVDGIFGLFGGGHESGTEIQGSSMAGLIGTVLSVGLPAAVAMFLAGSSIGKMAGAVMGSMGSLMSKVPGLGRFFGGGAAGAAGAAGTAGAAGAAGTAGAASRGASAVGTFLGGLGSGIGSILSGLAQGIAAFANPMVVLGAAAIGAAIVAIGAGIAGATWIMGKALPTLAEGMRAFAEIDGSALGRTGLGMISLGAGLAAMAAGSIVSGIAGLANVLPNLFGTGPMAQLQKFAEMAPRLELAASSITVLTDSLARLTSLDLSPLQGLSAITRFAGSINERAILGAASAVSNAGAPAGLQNPTITTAELNQRTVDYYDQSLRQFADMLELMRISNTLSRESNDISERGATTIEDAVRSINRI
jgi:hypothetical protein